MLRNKRESVEWLEFEIFQEFPQIAHATFLRRAGVSCTSEMMQEVMGCCSLERMHQVHGAEVREVPLNGQDEKCDGFFTIEDGKGLLVRHADCQAAIIYDPIQKVIAGVHAGWRGNVKNIYQEMVSQLKSRFGCKPENLIVGISPSLGPCCAQFLHFKTELPPSFWEFHVKFLYFDLWEVARRQWIEAGVLPHHLQIAKICTYCGGDDYFSYRRARPTEHHATVILKRPATQ
jgi:YfiH family protein